MQLKNVFAVAMIMALALHCYADDFTEEELKSGKEARTSAIKAAADKVDSLEKEYKESAYTADRKRTLLEQIKQAKKEYNVLKQKTAQEFAADAKTRKVKATGEGELPLPPAEEPSIDPELLFMAGDLHEAWEAKPLANPPKSFDKVPPTKQKGDRRLIRRGKVQGGITAFQYDSGADAGEAYDIILKGMGGDTEVLDGVGEQSRSFHAVTKAPPGLNIPDFEMAGIVFLRGKTVVYLQLSDMKVEELQRLAKKIDARIQQ